MTRQFLCLFFLSFCLASCSKQSTHWVSRAELQPASDANIKSVELVDGPVLEFNKSFGWYDAKKSIIEGFTITGWHDTIPLARVQRVEIDDEPTGGNTTIWSILLLGLILVVVGGIALFNSLVPRGGCLILVQLALVSAATMSAVLFLIFLY
jgi:hypothetical protein